MALSPTSSRGGGGASAPLTLTGTSDVPQLSVVGFAGQNDYISEVVAGGSSSPAWAVDAGGYTVQTGQLQIAASAGFDDELLQLQCDSSQTHNIMRVFLDGIRVFALTKEGCPSTLVHAAPADGSIAAGECALWFDQTDGVGNTKLMVKGKSADGTVKTATVLLA